jgi:hypothetical protein
MTPSDHRPFVSSRPILAVRLSLPVVLVAALGCGPVLAAPPPETRQPPPVALSLPGAAVGATAAPSPVRVVTVATSPRQTLPSAPPMPGWGVLGALALALWIAMRRSG